jgi:hypothetical protein
MVPGPTYVPKAWEKRVNNEGVSDSPITPRTPEILIFKVGIAAMLIRMNVRSRSSRQKQDLLVLLPAAPAPDIHPSSFAQPITHPVE